MNILDKIKYLYKAIRPFSLTASYIPIIISSIVAFDHKHFSFISFIICIFSIILLQCSVNLFDEYDDYTNKIDSAKTVVSSRVLTKGLLSPFEVKIGAFLCLFLGIIGGIFLTITVDKYLIIFAALGVLGTYSYTRKPFEFKYKGYGIPLVFIIFGVILVEGAYFVQTSQVSLLPIIIALPISLLCTAILLANDTRDIETDTIANIRTLSISLGKEKSLLLYKALIILPYIIVILLSLCKIISIYSLITLISLPILLNILNYINNDTALTLLVFKTARLHKIFGWLLIVALLI